MQQGRRWMSEPQRQRVLSEIERLTEMFCGIYAPLEELQKLDPASVSTEQIEAAFSEHVRRYQEWQAQNVKLALLTGSLMVGRVWS
jgi:hypothetical protein